MKPLTILAGHTYTCNDQTRVEVISVFGRGRNRKVKFKDTTTSRNDRFEKIGVFRAMIARRIVK